MKKIAATYIFTGKQELVKNAMLVCEDDGTIVEIIKSDKTLPEQHGLEYYSGILVPGFVNVHCHLELSHLKNKIEEKNGIGNFLRKINLLRNEETENLERAINIADRKMWAAGISAVGDISNSIHSISTKLKSKIYYHTFVESFGFHPERAEKSFQYAKKIQAEFTGNGLIAGIVPHSPYSVSKPLFDKIRLNAQAEKSTLTIHCQESKSEIDFFKDGTGSIANHFINNLNIDISHWKPTGKRPLTSIMEFLTAENPLILVHNTFIEKADLEALKENRSLGNTFFALCPNSNLFIENQLPPIQLLISENINICLGTDSLASNYELSILSEMKTLQDNFPEIKLTELLTWATQNGAKALNIEKNYGTFERGKKPGINLIRGIDFKKLALTENSDVKRLV